MKLLARNSSRGFTLLEVLVATTIMGLVFGGVFSAIVASNDLSFRTKRSLDRNARLRYLSNAALLYSTHGEALPNDLLSAEDGIEYEDVEMEFEGEQVMQTGPLQKFKLVVGGREAVQGLVWHRRVQVITQ